MQYIPYSMQSYCTSFYYGLSVSYLGIAFDSFWYDYLLAEFIYIIECNFTATRAIIRQLRGISLQRRHNDHHCVSNHQPYGCLLNRLFRRRSKKTSKLRVTGLCAGNSPGPVNSPHKGPVTRKMFPFDDVIMMRKISHELVKNDSHSRTQCNQTLCIFHGIYSMPSW